MATPTERNDMMSSTIATPHAVGTHAPEHLDDIETTAGGSFGACSCANAGTLTATAARTPRATCQLRRMCPTITALLRIRKKSLLSAAFVALRPSGRKSGSDN
jgi:hypothetical protein